MNNARHYVFCVTFSCNFLVFPFVFCLLAFSFQKSPLYGFVGVHRLWFATNYGRWFCHLCLCVVITESMSGIFVTYYRVYCHFKTQGDFVKIKAFCVRKNKTNLGISCIVFFLSGIENSIVVPKTALLTRPFSCFNKITV